MTRPLIGESDNGDAFFIATFDEQRAVKEIIVSNPAAPQFDKKAKTIDLHIEDLGMIAVIDGVGHGPEAAAITEATLECLRENCHLDLVTLMEQCHKNALHTRGATIGVAQIILSQELIEYIGVGNVQGQIGVEQVKRKDHAAKVDYNSGYPSMMRHRLLVNNNNTIGYRIPGKLNAFTYPFSPGDVLLLTSDGISLDAYSTIPEEILDPESLAGAVLSKYALSQDDATVVVAR